MRDVTERAKLFDALKHENGEVKLWGHACFIDPVIGGIVKNSLVEKFTDKKTQQKINYHTEKFQANMGVKITGEKFGFAKTYQNKKALLLFSGGQFELLGYGKVEWIRTDFESEVFIVKMESPYAKVHRETMGLSKHPVDHWNAGGWAGCLEYILGKKVACIETACIAQGKPHCEFVIKPADKWDKDDPQVKDNSFVFDDVPIELGKVRY